MFSREIHQSEIKIAKLRLHLITFFTYRIEITDFIL